MIKAIFLDIDGTLTSIKKHKIPESALDAVTKARSRGIRTFLCTSRAKQFLINLPGIEYDGLVCLTGAHCIDSDKNSISTTTMAPGDIIAALVYARNHGQSIVGVSSDKLYSDDPGNPQIITLFDTGGFRPEDIEGGFEKFPDFSAAEDPSAVVAELKIMQLICFFHSGAEENEIMAAMPHSHTQRWTEAFVDVMDNSITKAVGMKIMGRHFGFTEEESMAIGDGANDIPMLKAAGIGVAMGNATGDVKDAADYITDDVDEDGLANALKHFLKLD